MGIKVDDLLFLSQGYCYICKDELYSRKYICNDCLNIFSVVDGVKYIEETPCYYPFIYEGKLKELIHEYKFRDSIFLYKVFGQLLLEYIKMKQFKFDIILPVPLSRKKLYKRGYNQVDLLADYIGKNLNKEVVKDGIIKIKNTKDQHLLSMKERNINLKNSFKTKNIDKLIGRKILIIDDIVTSGNTFGEIINILNSNNIYSINTLAIASTKKESILKIKFKNI